MPLLQVGLGFKVICFLLVFCTLFLHEPTFIGRKPLKKELLRFTLFVMMSCVTGGAFNPAAASPPSLGHSIHFHGAIDGQWNKQHSDQFPNRHYARTSVANLNVGEPRTVRMIYFLPNDRSYNADVVQRMKDDLHATQKFFAEQMDLHGYGKINFRIETDSQGEPKVYRVDGDRPHDHYLDNLQFIFDEIEQRFDVTKNIYFILIDNHLNVVDRDSHGGAGVRLTKEGGWALHPTETDWKIVAHELGHAFGLSHDFRERAYIMGYGAHLSGSRLSECDAEYLSVHPYFNPDTPIEKGEPPTIELISPRAYPVGLQRVPVILKLNDSEGVHQVLLRGGVFSLIECRGLAGAKNDTVEFDYKGVYTETGFKSLSDLVTQPISVEAVDTDGNSSVKVFRLIIPEDRVDADVEVNIPDPKLRAAVAEAIGVSPSASIIRGWMAQLTYLNATEANISDLTGIEFATRLKGLGAWSNSISDISPLAGLANLRSLNLRKNRISDISPLAGLTKLTNLLLRENGISDISPLADLTNLIELHLSSNSISDISPLAGLTNLSVLYLSDNNISDISVLAGLTRLSSLSLNTNNISNLSAVAELTKLKQLHLGENGISDISPLAGLTNLFFLHLNTNFISDISPLVTNTGLRSGDRINVWVNPLSYPSIHTHIQTLQSRGVTVQFDDRTPTPPLKILGDNQQGAPGTTLEQPFVVEVRDQNGVAFEGVPVVFIVAKGDGTLSITNTMTDANGRAQSTLTLGGDLGTDTVEVSVEGIAERATFTALPEIEFHFSVPAGISLIHVPLNVTAVGDAPKTIISISDLYDVLGGEDNVVYLVTRDSQTQEWISYLSPSDRDTPKDKELTDDMGIIANLINEEKLHLRGSPLGTNGSSTITLNPGINLVGLPLRDPGLTHVSDLFALEGIEDNVRAVMLIDNGKPKVIQRASDANAIPIIGGQSFIMTVLRKDTVAISGEPWANDSGTAASPPVTMRGIEVEDVTPILGLRGSIVDEDTGLNKPNYRVTVKNFSTGRAVATVTTPDGAGYQLTVVDIETGRAAQIGDILEISAQSPDPFVGVEPLRYTVTAEDVKQSLIQLPSLIAYKIPAETELLSNYPNPFNPETWIPYRLAEDAIVTLTIYDQIGQVVRTLDVGHRIAAVYEGRSKAIYWDGRNNVGEGVASGVYFYHLSAGDYSATQKMVILK